MRVRFPSPAPTEFPASRLRRDLRLSSTALTASTTAGKGDATTYPFDSLFGAVRSRAFASPLQSAAPSRLALPPSLPLHVGNVLAFRRKEWAPQSGSRAPDRGLPHSRSRALRLLTDRYGWTSEQGSTRAHIRATRRGATAPSHGDSRSRHRTYRRLRFCCSVTSRSPDLPQHAHAHLL